MSFFGQPMQSGPSDPVVGYDELGRPVYQAFDGTQYGAAFAETSQPALPPMQGPDPAMGRGDRARRRDEPGNGVGVDFGAIAQSMMDGVLQGFTAPGRALQGEPVTMGDAWATALDFGGVANLAPAPAGALRGLNFRKRPDDYAGGHTAPGRDGYSSPAHSLAGDIYPDDIYSPQAVQYYGTGNRRLDAKTMRVLNRARGNPNAEIEVYRAVPKGVEDINNGDWVSVNRQYAVDHGESWLDGNYDIVAEKVRAGDLFTDGNSIHEFGWSPEPPPGITAYHGSPHDFDRFSMDKIGTGEGAQAYGHGLYFAENEGVARSYKDLHPMSKLSPTDGAGIEARAAFDIAKGNKQAAIGHLRRKIKTTQDASQFLVNGGADQIADLEGAIARIDAGEFKPGSMYEVRINADPDDFLDWDAPLSEQPGNVRRAFEGVAPESASKPAGDMGYMLNLAANEVAERDGSWKLAANKANVTPALRDAGIPGIRYRDAGSRGLDGAEGTRNFVVFDENLIQIVRKYGIAGAATMLGLSQAEVAEAYEAQRDPASVALSGVLTEAFKD